MSPAKRPSLGCQHEASSTLEEDQLVNTTDFCDTIYTLSGHRHNSLTAAHIAAITHIYRYGKVGLTTKIFDHDAFGHRGSVVERPLKLNAGSAGARQPRHSTWFLPQPA